MAFLEGSEQGVLATDGRHASRDSPEVYHAVLQLSPSCGHACPHAKNPDCGSEGNTCL